MSLSQEICDVLSAELKQVSNQGARKLMGYRYRLGIVLQHLDCCVECSASTELEHLAQKLLAAAYALQMASREVGNARAGGRRQAFPV